MLAHICSESVVTLRIYILTLIIGVKLFWDLSFGLYLKFAANPFKSAEL